ncbi:MAG: DUF362 domain-containing protein [candidate division KSB1 bacterium]|nr:DUF362 domain-containing protein [candidate division KSB1 bacterium]
MDKIIGVPVLKTSMEGGGITGCIKLMHGVVNTFNDRLKWHRTDLWYKLVDEIKPAGYHSVIWNGLDNSGGMVTSGVYYYRMTTPSFNEVKKMVLVR